jgi:LysM repeat protein
MNTPSPLVPQGSLPEAAKRKANIRIAIFTILAIHVALLGGLLMQGGCKQEEKKVAGPELSPPTNESTLPVIPESAYVAGPGSPTDTNPTPIPGSSSSSTVAGTEPPPSAPPASARETKEYAIAKGDTFARIAKAHGVSVRAIEEANPGVAPTKLKISQKIRIPASSGLASIKTEKGGGAPSVDNGAAAYTVKPGDSLFKIARQQGTTVKAIKSLNNLRTEQLRVGQKLKLPTAKAVTETAKLEPATIPATIATSNPLPTGLSNTASPTN